MIRIGNELRAPRSLARPVATVGAFDGVHKGHQRVLADLRKWADKLGAKSLVVTFDRLPRTLTRRHPIPCITSLEHRLVLFERFGIDACAVLQFDERMRDIPARDFVAEILCEKLRVRGVLLGYNCRFGRNAEGDFGLLQELEAEGICLARQSARPAMSGGTAVSSSAIREAIESGQLSAAARMLGRPVALLGTVVRGEGRGSKLGFPTANLDLHHELKPPAGVYFATARVWRKWMPALISIGRKPTFSTDLSEDVIEVFIPSLRRNIRGRDIEVRFEQKLREQKRFASAEALVRQVHEDVAALKGVRR